MAAGALPIIMFTLIWLGVGVGGPYFVPAGPHKQLIQLSLALTAGCCWLLWLCCYMSQMNPLVGPQVDRNALAAMHFYWGKLE